MRDNAAATFMIRNSDCGDVLRITAEQRSYAAGCGGTRM